MRQGAAEDGAPPVLGEPPKVAIDGSHARKGVVAVAAGAESSKGTTEGFNRPSGTLGEAGADTHGLRHGLPVPMGLRESAPPGR